MIMQVNFFYHKIPDKAEYTFHFLYQEQYIDMTLVRFRLSTFWQFGYIMLRKTDLRASQHLPFSFSKLFFTEISLKRYFVGAFHAPVNLHVLSIPCDISAPVSIQVPVSLDFKITDNTYNSWVQIPFTVEIISRYSFGLWRAGKKTSCSFVNLWKLFDIFFLYLSS